MLRAPFAMSSVWDVNFHYAYYPTTPERCVNPITHRMDITDSTHHIHLTKDCSACGFRLKPKDLVVSIFGNEGRMARRHLLKHSYAYPKNGILTSRKRGGLVHKRRGTWCDPMASPSRERAVEVPTLHSLCYLCLPCLEEYPERFRAFRWYIDAQNPYNGSPKTFLTAKWCPSPPTMAVVGKFLGIPSLGRLPLEITQAILSSSQDAPLWRLARSIEFGGFLLDLPSHDVVRVPLADVKSWTRGSAQVTKFIQNGKDVPNLRVTLDARGISKIERVNWLERPFTGQKLDSQAYMVLDQSQLEGAKLVIKYGIARFVLPPQHPGMQIWDTPTPPRLIDVAKLDRTTPDPPENRYGDPYLLEQCHLSGSRINVPSRFYSIDLRSVTGLTFIYGKTQGLVSIHAHTPDYPSVVEPADSGARELTWIHLPVPPGDRIEYVGVRAFRMKTGRSHTPSFVFRTRLAGNVHIGPGHLKDFHFEREKESPTILFTNKNDQADAIDSFGFYNGPVEGPDDNDANDTADVEMTELNGGGSRDTTIRVEALRGSTVDELGPLSHYSIAPLSNVVRVDKFFCETITRRGTNVSSLLQGLTLYYSNGAQRMLGDVRPGQEPDETILHPDAICFHKDNDDDCMTDDEGRPLFAIQSVVFHSPYHDFHGCDGWSVYPMMGSIWCDFTPGTRLVIALDVLDDTLFPTDYDYDQGRERVRRVLGLV